MAKLGMQGMEYAVFGVNHRTAPLAIRERLALSGSRLEEALRRLRASGALEEVVILSTCNRVELYVATQDRQASWQAVAGVLEEVCELGGGARDEFERHMYKLWGLDALGHLFRVASSLDSMVLGEPQILGQLKTAYAASAEVGSVGPRLNRAMHRAFSAAKRVRTETQIGEGGVSVAYVAAQLAERIFGSLRGRAVLLVGAGEMAELAARHLKDAGTSQLVIANRSLERAQALADTLQGVAHPLEELPHLLEVADIVITSTGSPRALLRRRHLQTIMRARKHRPLFMIDIAVPRDIEPACGELDNVYLYDVDDLQQVVADNIAERRREADSAQSIVTEEVERFVQWLGEADVVPTVVALRERFHAVREQEVERALRRLQHLDERDRRAVEALAQALTNKLLHQPSMTLKRYAQEGGATPELLDTVHELFQIAPAASSPEALPEDAAEDAAAGPAAAPRAST